MSISASQDSVIVYWKTLEMDIVPLRSHPARLIMDIRNRAPQKLLACAETPSQNGNFMAIVHCTSMWTLSATFLNIQRRRIIRRRCDILSVRRMFGLTTRISTNLETNETHSSATKVRMACSTRRFRNGRLGGECFFVPGIKALGYLAPSWTSIQ